MERREDVKAEIAKMTEQDLENLYPSVGKYIRSRYGLWSTNKALMESCRTVLGGEEEVYPDDASVLIIQETWKKLKETHALRLIK